jgi:hypothetical protein
MIPLIVNPCESGTSILTLIILEAAEVECVPSSQVGNLANRLSGATFLFGK